MLTEKSDKPLGHKAYGSIPHLPGSRLGPGDHHCHEGQSKICTERTRDKHDTVTVTVKLDGSCCAVANINGALTALSRAGWPADSSPYRQHHLFSDWVNLHSSRFSCLLAAGERAVGEWLAQAHGTRYNLAGREPFVIFDIFDNANRRIPNEEMRRRAAYQGFETPHILNKGGVCGIEMALHLLDYHVHSQGGYGEIDEPEGVVWRVERKGEFDFLAKYVKPGKVDGIYLPSQSGQPEIWNWLPDYSVTS